MKSNSGQEFPPVEYEDVPLCREAGGPFEYTEEEMAAEHEWWLLRQSQLLELDIERRCSAFLAGDRWRCFKMNGCYDYEWLDTENTLCKTPRDIGIADCLYIRYDPVFVGRSETLFIEWKKEGGRLRKGQGEWHVGERHRGALTLIAGEDFPPTVPGFVAWYRVSGLMRIPL